MPDKNITFEIREYLGVISQHDSGWNKELNIISWNGQSPKYDLRDWDPHHEKNEQGNYTAPRRDEKVSRPLFCQQQQEDSRRRPESGTEKNEKDKQNFEKLM